MKLENKIMLITYPDSLGNNLQDLSYVMKKYFKDIIGGIHILPFYPSSGDRGFAPITYEEVDSTFGSWKDIENLSKDFRMMYDFMINHISQKSVYFQDFLEKKDKSDFKDFFIRYKDFWTDGEPTEQDVDIIYKRKPRAPYFEAEFKDGTKEKVWCTFDTEQIDLNVKSQTARQFVKKTLLKLCESGASIIRIDAFAYTIKKIGTSCFFVEPETWELLDFIQDIVKPYDVAILPEIHEHYSIQLKLAQKGHWVYDFALPMLVLHSLYSGDNKRLIDWLKICPKNQFTTLDTHDGIGIVDVIDLMTTEEIEQTKEFLFSEGANVKRIYNTTKYNNLDTYQINCTYYSALGNNDDRYLLARAIQFFTPGIPQIYYMGLLAGENDIKLLEETKVGRNINRHYYTLEEIDEQVQKPVLKLLYQLMEFRNNYPAFSGDIEVKEVQNNNQLHIAWHKDNYECELVADLKTNKFNIKYFDSKENKTISLF